MRAISISRFKAACLAVLKQAPKSGAPVRITHRGEPIADVVPAQPEGRPASWLGTMADRTRVLGDITTASSEFTAWEAEERETGEGRGFSPIPTSGSGACKRLPG